MSENRDGAVRKCESCTWWKRVDNFARDHLPLGECRAGRPRVFQKQNEMGTLITRWPLVVSLDFCGQHRPGPVAEAGGAK